jgi:hypothetical protein
MFRAHSLRFWSLLGITFLGFHVACADDKYIVTNTWGSFGSNSGQFNLPFGLLTDPNLPVSIYVSDALNNRIQKFDDAGNFERFITGRTAAAPNQAGLAQWGGNLFAVDNGVNAIEIFKESDGSEIGVIFPGVTANSGDRLNRPVGAAFDNVGALYVVDQLNYRVEKFDQNSGQLLTKWGGPCKLGWPNGVPLPGSVSNQCTTPAGGSLGDGQFAEPTFIAYAISDSTLQPMLLVVDQGNARIEAFGTDGSFLFQFGSFGSANGQFWDPIGIAVEWHCAPGMTRPACRSLIFVGDDRNGRVQIFDTSGNFITKFGLPAQPGGAIPGTFKTPVGITVPVNFPLDRFIYVADRGTNTVQQFEPMPDDDNDGILNVIDTDPANFSNDFSDGAKNVGTIVDRGGQAMFNFVISKDISNRGSYSGNIRITTDPLGGASPLLIRACGMQYFLGVSAGSSTLLKCGSATATVEVGRASVKFIASSGATVESDLAAGQSLKIDPDASSVTALAGSVLVYINGNPVTLAAGQGVSLPPVAGISITLPRTVPSSRTSI